MRKSIVWMLLSIFILSFITACNAPARGNNQIQISAPTEPEAVDQPQPTPAATENPFGNWMEYKNEEYGFRFLYPIDWFGPEVHATEGSLRIEIGSDQVYPYGTSREDQVTTIPDSYYILIEYRENTTGRSWDDFINSGWIDTYLALQEMEDGQFTLTPRSVATRIGEVTLGDFSGLTYLVTIPDNAGTERVYMREVMLFDSDLNWLRISAYPNQVQIADPENWKNDYARVDQENLDVFLTLLESIEIK